MKNIFTLNIEQNANFEVLILFKNNTKQYFKEVSSLRPAGRERGGCGGEELISLCPFVCDE